MRYVKILVVCIYSVIASGTSLLAQINPLNSQFFVNPFLINPSKAGDGETGMVSAGFSTQWNKIPGGPEILSLAVESPVSKRIGLGGLIINDKSGLIKRTVVMGSYSYKVPLSEYNRMRFGLAMGYLSDNINVGDAVTPNGSTDPALVNYNYQHENLLKAGFGTTINFQKLEIQSSWFRINRRINPMQKSVDRSGITTTIKYTFGDPSVVLISPLVGYRKIYGLSDYADAGVNVSYLSVLDLSMLYHTNKSITGGFSFDYNEVLKLSCFYNSEPPEIRGLSGGTFELSLGMPFSIRKNK